MQQQRRVDRRPIAQRLAEAVQHHLAGRVKEAEGVYREILETDPEHVDVLHLLGVLAHQTGRSELALEYLRKAVRLKPDMAAYHAVLGNSLAALGRSDEAIESYRQAVAIDPKLAEALCDLGTLLLQTGRIDEAIARYDQAIAAKPDFADAFANLGAALRQKGRFDEAIAACRKAVGLRPQDEGALVRLGNALHAKGELAEAIEVFRQALALHPRSAEALANLGNCLRSLDRRGEALDCYERAIAEQPNFVEVLSNLGIVLREEGRPEEAAAYCRRAIALKPSYAPAYTNLAAALHDVGRADEARQNAETALGLAPPNAVLFSILAETKRFRAGDAHLGAMEKLQQCPSLSAQDAILLHFALAKAYNDLDEPERAFRQMAEGNARHRARITYDETFELGLLRRIEAVFTADLIESKKGLGDPSRIPVFIVGMPRSGTSLLEQILASHREIHGAGEIYDFELAVKSVPVPPGAPRDFPEVLPSLGAHELQRLGSDYIGRIRSRAPSAARIVDKLPGNFLYAGLVSLALPNARILHIQRNPLDTCMSCFSKLFQSGHGYSFDLRELGRYYKAYARLMAHWREILPPGAMLEVRYEELVADLETQARRIVDYCGLDWDPACLAFHRTDRPVQTPSALQVRQPIYDSSIGRSREYLPLLQPLLDELS